MKLEALPAAFPATRTALHMLAEHVIAPKRYAIDGHISLVPTIGGFGTPVLANGVCVRVEGTALVTQDAEMHRRASITTLADAAAFVDGPLGAPANVYPPATECDPDATLPVDADAAAVLATWLAFADGLLAELREEFAAQTPSNVLMWPEHFDMSCDLGDADAGTRANYGASPGDETIEEPYLYVGPWDASRRTGDLAAYPFGAAFTYGELRAGADTHTAGMDFYRSHAVQVLG